MEFEYGTLEGQFDSGFWISVPMAWRSKSNFRRQKKSTSWNSLASFEKQFSFLVRDAIPKGWVFGSRDLAVSQRPAVVCSVFAFSTLDASNLSKSVLDACEGEVFFNDSSVRMVSNASVRTRMETGGAAAFAQIPGGSSLKDIFETLASLNEKFYEEVISVALD